MAVENDFLDGFKDFIKLAKENYREGFDIVDSLLEENCKSLYKRLDWLTSIEEDNYTNLKEFYSRLSKEMPYYGWNDSAAVLWGMENILKYQKGLVSYIKGNSDNYQKWRMSVAKNNTEKVFSMLNEYMDMMKF